MPSNAFSGKCVVSNLKYCNKNDKNDDILRSVF